MVNPLSCYRVYANTLSSVEHLPYAILGKEIHIVLPFARDYTSSGSNTSGKFEAYFDKSKFDADAIKAVKERASFTSVKFFLSIGGRDPRFPFQLTSDESTWIQSATSSLKKIVTDYGFDGIDVYYEHIDRTAEGQFADTVFQVVSNLKRDRDLSPFLASITVSARLNNRYCDLFMKSDRRFDYVVYQTHTELARISRVGDLLPVFDRLRYPLDRTLAGHSDIPRDWANVPPPVFLGAVPQLFDKGLPGFSKWIVSPNDHNPEQ